MMKFVVVFLFMLFPVLFESSLASQSIMIGNSLLDKQLPEFSDQFNTVRNLSEKDRFLVFTADMEASKFAHELFESRGEKYLFDNGIFFISDIHRMPSFITRIFALPKMKEYKYPIHLIRDDQIGRNFHHQKGKLTIYKLNKYIVQEIYFLSSSKELEELFAKK